MYSNSNCFAEHGDDCVIFGWFLCLLAMGQHEVLSWMLSLDSLKDAVHLTDDDLGTPAHDAADNG